MTKAEKAAKAELEQRVERLQEFIAQQADGVRAAREANDRLAKRIIALRSAFLTIQGVIDAATK